MIHYFFSFVNTQIRPLVKYFAVLNKKGRRTSPFIKNDFIIHSIEIQILVFGRQFWYNPVMKIGILGGSFDPPHIGQYLVIKQVLEVRKDLDKILIVPAYKHQWKSAGASVKDRLEMAKSLIQEKAEISEIEIKRKGINYTIDTIKEIKKKTKAEILWIIGSDIIYEFNRWKKTDQLTSFATFLVFPRDPYHLPQKMPKGFELITNHSLITTNISSTKIRKRIKEGKSIKHLVPEEVEEYIIQKKLYK